jgi:cellulase
MKTSILTAAVLGAAHAAAHATFQQLWVDGVDQEGKCVRTVPSNSPIQDPASADFAVSIQIPTFLRSFPTII